MPPTVSISQPATNSNHNTFDTLIVSAQIQDDREISFVSVELLNADLVSVVTPYSTRPNTNTTSYNLNALLIIDNIQLTSGKHYILVTAKDSKNTTREYREIFVSGIPYTTKGYMSFENVGGSMEVHSYFQGSDTLLLSTGGNLSGGIVDSYHQQFGILNESTHSFHAFPLNQFIDAWEISNLHGGVNVCRSQANSLPIQLCFENGIVSFYEGEASLKRSFNSATNYRPYLSMDLNNHAITWQLNTAPNSNRIETFFPSGSLNQVTNYPGSVVGLEARDDNFAYIVSNLGSNAIVDVFSLTEGVYTSYQIEDVEFYDSCTDGDGNLFIASSTGIKKFDKFSFQFTNYSSHIAKEITWNLIFNRAVIATSNELIELNQLGGTLISQPLQGDCVELSVWYSK